MFQYTIQYADGRFESYYLAGSTIGIGIMKIFMIVAGIVTAVVIGIGIAAVPE